MTPLQLLNENWKDCDRCELHLRRKRVVMWRGECPALVLFIGEAPGKSEDVLGVPFVGPAGKLLDTIIRRATAEWQVPGTIGPAYNQVTWAMTNLVACIPKNDAGDKVHEPEPECIEACKPRLEEFVRICQPRLIVNVGKLASEYMEQGFKHSVKLPYKIMQIAVTHPAAILRANLAQQGFAVKKCVINIRDAIKEVLTCEDEKGSGRKSLR